MLTAVDTNVLFDIFLDDPQFVESSLERLEQCLLAGPVVACEVVWAEVSAAFANEKQAKQAMAQLRVEFSPMSIAQATLAGQSWRAYRERGGTRTRITSDFLIGANAALAADVLLTRDGGFAALGISGLELI